MIRVVLEDQFNDIILKAWRGSSLGREVVTRQAGVSLTEFQTLLDGGFDPSIVRKVAPVLGLESEALVGIALGRYQPRVSAPVGLGVFTSTYRDFTVNAYLVWDDATKQACAFDTGADPAAMLGFLKQQGLHLGHIFLTHTHRDHVGKLAEVQAQTGAPAHVSAREPLAGAEPIEAGVQFACGALSIMARRTAGHTVGGLSYVVEGLSTPVVVVGDALFAGSIGGGLYDYQMALQDNREAILALDENTVIAPGHGPLTTVGLERRNNPFFAG